MLALRVLMCVGAAAASKTHVMTSRPTGPYKGSEKVLGEKIKAEINIKNASHLDLSISGATNINCVDEPYVFSGRDVLLADTSSTDCVQHKLDKKHAVFKSATYDMSKNSLTVDVTVHVKKLSGGERKIDVSLELAGE